MEANESKIRKIGDILVDVGKPLKARFRALFTLRNIGLLLINYYKGIFPNIYKSNFNNFEFFFLQLITIMSLLII